MSDANGGVMATGVPRPAFTAELLADLHADNVTPEQREQLWPAVSRDADALRFLRSLDEVSAELRALGRDERIIHPMPADIAARLTRFVEELNPVEDATAHDATIDPLPSAPTGESDDESAVSEPSPAQPITLGERRRGRLRWLAAAAAAILAVAGAGVVVSTLRGGDDPTPTAGPAPGSDPLGEDLTATVALSALGRHTVTGTLANPAALDRCVHANGIDRTVLGSTDINFRGRTAVLILLTGPHPPKITALVVGTGCSTGDPQRRALQDIG
ncbi:hypothetical protein OHA40_15545 [Nocardia sp. NBC_00508]|uniref:hypothetical protein n=1 Tax=Nocardia sp. NBC_00508 TaxID=2975992 RepID=UPI002E805084|nr:hypothetical protein [Nocardia sp. NBC_00508]WUD69411.1 hypothetical protein OHA40_15545 [Nocardia sp. NBC_00508]